MSKSCRGGKIDRCAISPDATCALIEPIADRGSPIMANRTLAVIRRMLNSDAP
jgi:hypothetical protein